MRETKKTRILLNILVILLVVIGLAATGIFGWKKYTIAKVPEFYKEKTIKKMVQEDCEEKKIIVDEIKSIKVEFADDFKVGLITADVLTKEPNVVTTNTLNYTYSLVDNKWEQTEKSITKGDGEWNLPGTTWVVQTEDGSLYKISFDSMESVRINIEEKQAVTVVDEADLNIDSNIEDVPADETVDVPADETEDVVPETEEIKVWTLEDVEKELQSQKKGKRYQAVVSRDDGTNITFIITAKQISVDLGNEEGEVIMEKE